MNNRNWIAVFFGLAALVLFVGVFSASGNWMNNNDANKNNGASPQQISQTLPNVDNNKAPDGTLPTEINSSGIMSTTQSAMSNMTNTNNTTNNQNDKNSSMLNMPSALLPSIAQ